MASPNCDFSCEYEEEDLRTLSSEEIETLELRSIFDVKVLCIQHYYDQFSRYHGWQKIEFCLVSAFAADSTATS